MAKSIHSVNKKKMGRPATGHDPVVAARVPEDVVARVEKWVRNPRVPIYRVIDKLLGGPRLSIPY